MLYFLLPQSPPPAPAAASASPSSSADHWKITASSPQKSSTLSARPAGNKTAPVRPPSRTLRSAPRRAAASTNNETPAPIETAAALVTKIGSAQDTSPPAAWADLRVSSGGQPRRSRYSAPAKTAA